MYQILYHISAAPSTPYLKKTLLSAIRGTFYHTFLHFRHSTTPTQISTKKHHSTPIPPPHPPQSQLPKKIPRYALTNESFHPEKNFAAPREKFCRAPRKIFSSPDKKSAAPARHIIHPLEASRPPSLSLSPPPRSRAANGECAGEFNHDAFFI